MYNLIERKRLKDELVRVKEELRLEKSKNTTKEVEAGTEEGEVVVDEADDEEKERKAQEEEDVNNAKAKFLATICHGTNCISV